MRVLVDTKYEKSDLYKVMENQCQHLKSNEFIKLLQKIEEFFDVTLGTCKTHPVELKLKGSMKTICS